MESASSFALPVERLVLICLQIYDIRYLGDISGCGYHYLSQNFNASHGVRHWNERT